MKYSSRLNIPTRRALIAGVPILCSGLFVAVGWAAAREQPRTVIPKISPIRYNALESPMTDHRISTYESYLKAWSAVPDDERLALLRMSVTDKIVFKNATKSRAGIPDMTEHLSAFQHKTPGASFRLLGMLGFENYAMATWQFVDAKGVDGFMGYDTITFDNDRRIESIVMFTKVGPQTLR